MMVPSQTDISSICNIKTLVCKKAISTRAAVHFIKKMQQETGLRSGSAK
jgi:hypothetical protein